MAKAIIKSKTGSIITVEGTEKEVSGILVYLETAVAVEHTKKIMKKATSEKKEQKKRSTASDLVITLKEEGFFDNPKELKEVVYALEEKGYIYPVTTLSGVMMNLVQKKFLGRKKIDGKWAYGK